MDPVHYLGTFLIMFLSQIKEKLTDNRLHYLFRLKMSSCGRIMSNHDRSPLYFILIN